MKKLLLILTILWSCGAYSSIVKNMEKTELFYTINSTTNWTAEVNKNIVLSDISGNDVYSRVINTNLESPYTDDNSYQFTYMCIDVKTTNGKQDLNRRNISLKIINNKELKLISGEQYSVTIDNNINKASFIGTYLEGNKNLGFSFKDTDKIRKLIANGGNVSMTVKNKKITFNFDGFKEGYKLMKDCTN